MAFQTQDEYEKLSKIPVDSKSPTLFLSIQFTDNSTKTETTTNENEKSKKEKDLILINPSNCQTKTNLNQINASKCCYLV